jgi:hypothetical protein
MKQSGRTLNKWLRYHRLQYNRLQYNRLRYNRFRYNRLRAGLPKPID